jgi:hypothetical protein
VKDGEKKALKEFSNWKDYQNKTAAIFKRQGCSVVVEAKVQGVRAKHEVDVYVTFLRHGIGKWGQTLIFD